MALIRRNYFGRMDTKFHRLKRRSSSFDTDRVNQPCEGDLRDTGAYGRHRKSRSVWDWGCSPAVGVEPVGAEPWEAGLVPAERSAPFSGVEPMVGGRGLEPRTSCL